MLKSPVRGIVVLDGPDHCGKTTLAEAISEANAYHGGQTTIIHLTYRWPGKMDLYHFAAIRRAIKLSRAGHLVVLDRWWPSEEAYAWVFRGGSKHLAFNRMLDNLAKAHGALYIMCLPTDPSAVIEGHAKRWADGKEMYKDIEPLFDVYEAMDNEFKYREDWHRYNYQRYLGPRLAAYAELVLMRVALMREHCAKPVINEGWDGLVGNPQAGYLFVGERLNPKLHGHQYPFVENGNASRYLYSTLMELGVDLDDVQFGNAFLGGGYDKHLIHYIHTSSPRKWIIPLGRLAADHLLSANVSVKRFVAIPHPAAASRFPDQGALFKRRLKEIFDV